MKQIHVSIRGDQAYVAACGGWPAYRWIIRPVNKTAANDSDLAAALTRFMASAPELGTVKDDENKGKDLLLEASGLKSTRTLAKGCKVFHLVIEDSQVVIERWAPYPGGGLGYACDQAWTKTFPPDTDPVAIAQIILRAAPETASF